MPERSGFAYVVLQYGGFDITCRCLDSISAVNPDSQIIVVDNCSPADACRLVQNYAEGHPLVHVLTSGTNSGFSHGNNIGYQYARDTLEAEYIVVLNNDVEIYQGDFEQCVIAIHGETDFAVLGPDIYIPSKHEHQNPFHASGSIWHPDNPSLADINELLDYTQGLLDGLEKPEQKPSAIERVKHLDALSGLRKRKHEAEQKESAERWASRWTGRFEDVPLQGACYVFGPKFISEMPLCFVPEPFLYCEEILLQMNCLHKGLKMVFDSSLRVIHHEGESTGRLFDADEAEKRLRFELENKYKSECLCGLYRCEFDEIEGHAESNMGERAAMKRRAADARVSLERYDA